VELQAKQAIVFVPQRSREVELSQCFGTFEYLQALPYADDHQLQWHPQKKVKRHSSCFLEIKPSGTVSRRRYSLA